MGNRRNKAELALLLTLPAVRQRLELLCCDGRRACGSEPLFWSTRGRSWPGATCAWGILRSAFSADMQTTFRKQLVSRWKAARASLYAFSPSARETSPASSFDIRSAEANPPSIPEGGIELVNSLRISVAGGRQAGHRGGTQVADGQPLSYWFRRIMRTIWPVRPWAPFS